jgi:hypothetical protein
MTFQSTKTGYATSQDAKIANNFIKRTFQHLLVHLVASARALGRLQSQLCNQLSSKPCSELCSQLSTDYSTPAIGVAEAEKGW